DLHERKRKDGPRDEVFVCRGDVEIETDQVREYPRARREPKIDQDLQLSSPGDPDAQQVSASEALSHLCGASTDGLDSPLSFVEPTRQSSRRIAGIAAENHRPASVVGTRAG